jgi:hypothetical protein
MFSELNKAELIFSSFFFFRERRPARLAGWGQVRLSYNFLSRLTATHFQHNIALHTIRQPPQSFSDQLSQVWEGEKKIYIEDNPKVSMSFKSSLLQEFVAIMLV